MANETFGHESYCLEIPETRRGCYCWESGQNLLHEMRIENLTAEIRHLKSKVARLERLNNG